MALQQDWPDSPLSLCLSATPHPVFLCVWVPKPALTDTPLPPEAALAWCPLKADVLRCRGRLVSMNHQFLLSWPSC